MKSKTKINTIMKKKTNSMLVETILLAKQSGQVELASELAKPARIQASVNLGRLNEAKTDCVIIPGKVLSSGEISKKLTVYALSFSDTAKEKLKQAGCTPKLLIDALKSKEKLKGELIK